MGLGLYWVFIERQGIVLITECALDGWPLAMAVVNFTSSGLIALVNLLSGEQWALVTFSIAKLASPPL